MSFDSKKDRRNSMAEYLLKIQCIINNTEFKNKTEAMRYETVDTKLAGDAYVRAITKTDTFESYQYDPKVVYKLLEKHGYDESRIFYLIKNSHMIPQNIKNTLMEEQRDILIAQYVERNQYYVMLLGKPFPGDETTPAETELCIPDEFYMLYKDDNVLQRNQPIHEMPIKYQELFMNSKYYSDMIKNNPDIKYLKYIGSNSIPIHVSRAAHDGDILKINTNKLSIYDEIFGNVTVSPDIIHMFTKTYKETRDYVYNTLRGDFGDIYENYDSFIRFLTIYMAIGNTMNELMRKSSSMIYMNNATANDFFVLYGLPSVIMEGASMIDFLKKFRSILVDKGTNTVYRVKDLIGYEYTDIYTLIMVKQQVFENGIPIYYYDSDGFKHPKQEIVFRRLGTTDDNTSYFKFKNTDTAYTIDEITSGDPRWWNTPEVERMLSDMNYTLSNSKYIQLSTHLSMTDIWWQCVILLRGLLDNKQETMFQMMSINYSVDGSSEISIFDAVLTLVILMNWHLTDFNNRSMKGDMYLANGIYRGRDVCLDLLFNGLNNDGSPKELIKGLPYKLSSFNFKIREKHRDFYDNIKNLDYIEPDKFLPMLNVILDREDNNVGEVLMTDVKLIYKYLENKLRNTRTIREFRQTTDVFSHLFLVEPVRDWYDDMTFNSDAVLIDEYGITMNELYSLKSFFKENEYDTYVEFNNIRYDISLYQILNNNVNNIKINEIYPFRDKSFLDEFNSVMGNYVSNNLLTSSISSTIKDNYQNIIIDKVLLDFGNTAGGPKTFESLLFRQNASLYRKLISMKNNNENTVLLMRSLIKALEGYTNSQLSGLEFKVIGVDEYFKILKEVISYFKSYMVEFTKDEFVYLFDGIFDNGGNSNMLKLYDEISTSTIDILPTDSLTLYDVSCADMDVKLSDDNIGMLYDDAVFRIETTYQSLLDSDYDIWYDDNTNITKTPFDISPDTIIVVDLIMDSDNGYKLIINKNNINTIPPNYVGNVLPL